jgi:hypothetical protein
MSLHGLDGSGRVRTSPKWVRSSRDGSKTDRVSHEFFEIFLSVPVLDPSVLTDHGSDGLGYGLGQTGSWPQIQRIGSDPHIFFENTTCILGLQISFPILCP